MGRKSSLTDVQWIEIERRHLVDGVSLNALAKEFGVNESSLRRKIKPNKAEAPNPAKNLRVIAEKMVAADATNKHIAELFGALPLGQQRTVSELARKLSSISDHVGSAAEFSAASMHRLAMMANQQLDLVDDVDPLKSLQRLKAFSLLQGEANSAGTIPMNLLKSNKEAVEEMNRGNAPAANTSHTIQFIDANG